MRMVPGSKDSEVRSNELYPPDGSTKASATVQYVVVEEKVLNLIGRNCTQLLVGL
jgi:hypothetical protein